MDGTGIPQDPQQLVLLEESMTNLTFAIFTAALLLCGMEPMRNPCGRKRAPPMRRS
jgi:hypothetical protein